MKAFPMSRVVVQTMGRDLSFESSGKEKLYLLVSWAASASETALLTSVVSSSKERMIQLKPRMEGLLDILVGEGGKVSAEEIEEREGEFVGIVKFDTMDMMSKY